jgi:hypothetical protein
MAGPHPAKRLTIAPRRELAEDSGDRPLLRLRGSLPDGMTSCG